jgi:hypothetical protein
VKPLATPRPPLVMPEVVTDTVCALALAFVIAHVLAVIIMTAPIWWLAWRFR